MRRVDHAARGNVWRIAPIRPSARSHSVGIAAGGGLALADLVAVDHQHARARARELAGDGQARERRAADQDVGIARPERRALGAALGLAPRHGRETLAPRRHGAPDAGPLTFRAVSETDVLTPAGATAVEGSDGLLLEIDGQIIPNYDATIVPFSEGDVVTGQGRADRQGRGPRRHRLQERGSHPVQRALDPQVGQPGRRGRAGRGGRRARPHQGGSGRPADPVQEARPLREGVAPHRGRRRVRRAGRGHRHRGRQGRPDHRPRRARLPARLAGRHPPRPEPRRVPRPEDRVQGHRAQPLAQQRRALAAARCSRRSARRSASRSSTGSSPVRSWRARSRTSSTSARSWTSTASTA